MFKIGDFSKLSQVSVKTLRFYDELGLLKPVEVDRFTGYRYYSAGQLPRLNRILVYKELGFSLEQIKQLLDDKLPTEQIRGMLRLRQAEIQQLVQAEQARLTLIETRLRQIEQENTMATNEVVIKEVPAQLVAGLKGVVPSWAEAEAFFAPFFAKGTEYVAQHGNKFAGPTQAIYPDTEYHDHDISVEAVYPISEPIPASDEIQVYELPAVKNMACIIHIGLYTEVSKTYEAMMKWLEANNYRIVGPSREVYLEYDPNGDPSKYVTEIQFPVEKI
jgi:DNA-binding transcriptional MerR regulator